LTGAARAEAEKERLGFLSPRVWGAVQGLFSSAAILLQPKPRSDGYTCRPIRWK